MVPSMAAMDRPNPAKAQFLNLFRYLELLLFSVDEGVKKLVAIGKISAMAITAANESWKETVCRLAGLMTSRIRAAMEMLTGNDHWLSKRSASTKIVVIINALTTGVWNPATRE